MNKRSPSLGYYSDPAILILSSLADGPKHGYAMIEDIDGFSRTRLEPGTLYGALIRLERLGWIEPLPAEERRRPYRITADGLQYLREQLKTMQSIVTVGFSRLAES